MKNFSLALSAALLLSGAAHASIIVSLATGSPTAGPVAGQFTYNYNADLTGDERMDPAATNGVTCPGFGGGKVQCNPTGTFFTIYDVAGFVNVGSVPANFTASTSNTGVTPSSINGGTIDNPALINVTFTYNGPVVNGPSSFTGFQIISTFSTTTPNGNFTSQSTKNTGLSTGDTDQTVGPLAVPVAPTTQTPEPASIGLIGLGMSGLALFGRRISKK